MSQAIHRYDHSRRRFLLGAGALAAGAALPDVLFASSGGEARFVVIILRGALDGLAAVPPYADPHYAGLHRELAIPPPAAAGGALDLDGHFGLHPALAFLHERYRAKELLVLHAVASPYRDRSHFDAQAVLENGLTHAMGSADGWLNRALAAMPVSTRRSSPRQGNDRALALSQNVPLILRGAQEVLSKSPQVTPEMDEDLMARLADLYSKDDWFSARLSEAVQSEKLGRDTDAPAPAPMADRDASTAPALNAGNPKRQVNAHIQKSAQMAAAIMAADGGPEIAVLEASGWDTHANQGGAQGTLANRLSGLDQSLRAFAGGLGPLWKRTVVMVVTEFGRTAAMNGTRGTDHGTGTCCFLVGGAVDGGRVETQWPGLAPTDLYQGRDLSPTQDLRGVFKAVLSDHLTIDRGRLERTVFPDSGSVKPLSGLIRA